MPYYIQNGLIISPTPHTSSHANPDTHKATRVLLEALTEKWISDQAWSDSMDASIEFSPRTPTNPAYQNEIVVIETCASQTFLNGEPTSEKENNIQVVRYCSAEDEVSLWNTTSDKENEKTDQISVGKCICKLGISENRRGTGHWICTAETIYEASSGEVDKSGVSVLGYKFELESGELCGIHAERRLVDGSICTVGYVRDRSSLKGKEARDTAAIVSGLALESTEMNLHRIGGNCCPRQLFEEFI